MDPEFHFHPHRREADLTSLSEAAALALLMEAHAPDAEAHADHDLMCANIISQLGHASRGGYFPKPLALILTKCDLNPDLLNGSNRSMRYFQEQYPITFSQLSIRVRKSRVFATSSLGHVGDESVPSQLNPIGIWDPVTWLVREIV